MSEKVGILGCGRIAAGVDVPEGPYIIQTHAKAIYSHPKYNLHSCYDVLKDKAKTLQKTWGVSVVHSSLDEFFADTVDICVIATPTPSHSALLAQALESNVKTIICEKPIVDRLEELDNFEKPTKPIIANFIRRWDKNHQQLRETIESGDFGELLSFHGFISKGLIHNGSHMIDLFFYLFKQVNDISPLSCWLSENDLFGSFQVNIGNDTMGIVQVLDKTPYSFFELELVFSQARVSIRDIGNELIIQKAKPSLVCPGFLHLDTVSNPATTLNTAMYNLYDDFSQNVVDIESYWRQAIKGSRMLLELKHAFVEGE